MDFSRRLRDVLLKSQQDKSLDIPMYLAKLAFGLSVLGFVIVIIRVILR